MRGFLIFLCLLLFLPLAGMAQDAPPPALIREESAVKVTRGGRTASSAEIDSARPTPEPTPTPDPHTVLVAIVNGHSLTRAQLDRLLEARIGKIKAQLAEEEAHTDGVLAAIAPDGLTLDKALVEQNRLDRMRDSIRKEEGLALLEWIEHKTLADEAARQGIVVAAGAIDKRLAKIQRELGFQAGDVHAILNEFGMTEAELETYVYEALLIEGMLDRYVDQYVPQSALRAAYEKSPGLYQQPPLFKVAHFSVGLLGDESARDRRRARGVADLVRKDLEKGRLPEDVFKQHSEVDNGMIGTVLGFFNVEQEGLPPIVRYEIGRMRKGTVSNVLEAKVRLSDGSLFTESYHVVKVLDILPGSGETFESAMPQLRESARGLARETVLTQIQNAKTHRQITNLGGIPPAKIPARSELDRPQPPVALR
ncbi:MAG: peptidylprolyl isomerase [Sumerlaeia bacterium]